MAAVGLILRTGTEPIPCSPGEPARCCRDEVMNVRRCLTVVAEDERTYLAVVVKPVHTMVTDQPLFAVDLGDRCELLLAPCDVDQTSAPVRQR